MKFLRILIVASIIFPKPLDLRIEEIRTPSRFELRIDDSEHELSIAPTLVPSFYIPASPSCVWIGGRDWFFESGLMMFFKMI